MINIFHIYVFGMHAISYAFVFLSFLIGMYLQPRSRALIYKIVVSLLMCQFGNYFYELNYFFFAKTAENSYTTLATLPLYAAVAGFLLIGIVYLHRKYALFSINKYSVVCFTLLYSSMFVLLLTNHYEALSMWQFRLGPDPHNAIWALSKFMGFLWPVMLLTTNKGSYTCPDSKADYEKCVKYSYEWDGRRIR